MAWPRTPASCSRELEPPHAKAKGSECRSERKPRPQALAAGREQACRRVRRPAGRSWGACDSRDADEKKRTRHSRPSRIYPCASGMIPLESPVPASGTPGSVSGERKRS